MYSPGSDQCPWHQGFPAHTRARPILLKLDIEPGSPRHNLVHLFGIQAHCFSKALELRSRCQMDALDDIHNVPELDSGFLPIIAALV